MAGVKIGEKGAANMQPPITEIVWPLGVYAVAVLILVTATIAISSVLGERHTGKATGEPYESGIVPTGPSSVRFSVRFYLVAMFFVLFDLEAVFIYAWAVSLREAGWAGYAEMVFFIGVLLTALAYLWRIGALDWGSIGRKSLDRRKEETRRDADD
jgi:NADH-quinone oxidoreductase subunit A